MPNEPSLRIAWTTVETSGQAEKLARLAVESNLAACVQIDAPIRSVYQWKGTVESTTEVRLWIKYPAGNEMALWELIRGNHPYGIPQWIAVDAAAVSSAYRDWALGQSAD
ncbi:MAG: divalent-cation tolerance protein CutA [Oceanipulchritudo sp.]|jgi:periplasmic divalent cation tolerance protein